MTKLFTIATTNRDLAPALERSIELVRARKLRDARLELEFVDPATLPTEEECLQVHADLGYLIWRSQRQDFTPEPTVDLDEMIK